MFQFKELMLCIDPPDDEDSEGDGKSGRTTPNPAKPDAAGTATVPTNTAADPTEREEAVQEGTENHAINADGDAHSTEASKPHNPPPPPTHHTGHVSAMSKPHSTRDRRIGLV